MIYLTVEQVLFIPAGRRDQRGSHGMHDLGLLE
jgi:hypothetical protein